MLKFTIHAIRGRIRSCLGLAVALLWVPGVLIGSQGVLAKPNAAPAPTSDTPATSLPPSVLPAPTMMESSVQLDPLNSPHPVPWNWVLATQDEVSSSQGAGLRYYRSRSLVSPDGDYAAYSRLQMQVQPEMYRSRVSSVMFLENLKTGDLQVVTATSPLATNPRTPNKEAEQPGAISMIVPIAWSENSDRLLARQFEGFFNTSDASDYAVIWERRAGQAVTVAPTRMMYSNAILLGWSQEHPDRVLFQAGELGDESWPLWSVDTRSETRLANTDQPLIFGQMTDNVWSGPQAYYQAQ